MLAGVLLFGDGLRPELDLARGRVLRLPFSLLSALHLTIRRAARSYQDGPYDEIADLTKSKSFIGGVGATLGQILNDPLVRSGEWDDEKIVEVDDAPTSVRELRHRLPDSVGARVCTVRYGPAAEVAKALLFRHVDMVWCPDKARLPGYHIRSGTPPQLRGGWLQLPLNGFAHYQPGDKALSAPGGPVNGSHPLARWLIENLEQLTAAVPLLLRQLRGAVEEMPVPGEQKNRREQIGGLLDQVRQATDRSLWPPDEAYSIHYDWMRDCAYCRGVS